MIELLGYFSALLIGVVLGLTGGGGSILTVPVFVYLLGIEPVLATGYSLFVVGISSLFGTVKNLQKRLVNFKTSLFFAIPAAIMVFSTRKFIIPALPEVIYSNASFLLTKDIAIMVFFSILMLAASFSMILDKKRRVIQKEITKSKTINYFPLVSLGALVGIITGLVGAGGGFIIVPILIFLAKLPIKQAVATSLFVIAINSLVGFAGDALYMPINWPFLLTFSAFAIVGILVGIYLNKFVDSVKLKIGFGWMVLGMGIYIFWKELM